MSKPVVNVLYAPGTNSHKETLHAFNVVGADARLLPLAAVLNGDERLDSGDALCIPGGFAYGDHLGAGAIAGQLLRNRLGDQLANVAQRPVIAICNGFQIAVRAGLFGDDVALDINSVGTFRHNMRQTHIVDSETKTVWFEGMAGQELRFPCAHGEGRFVFDNTNDWQTALRYPADENPDGSTDNIAGIADPNGMILGMMNHPERLLSEPGNLEIFANGVRAAS